MVTQLSSGSELIDSSDSMSSDFESVSVDYSMDSESSEPKGATQCKESMRALHLIALDEEAQKNLLNKYDEKDMFKEKMLLKRLTGRNNSEGKSTAQ